MAVIKSAGNGSALSVEMMGGAGPTPRRGSSTVDRTPWKRRRGKSAAGGREDPSGTRKKKKKKPDAARRRRRRRHVAIQERVRAAPMNRS